jgi:hypothetical protein
MNRRLFAGAITVALLLVTIYLSFGTVNTVVHSQTNVLSRDQWWFAGELQSLYEGKNWAQLLWSPYWGHRPVLVRLLFYLDAQVFSFRSGPLLCLSWSCLLGEILLLVAVNKAIFGSVFAWRFGAALIVLLNLFLSSFQMENLIWALQLQYLLVFFFATASFVSFSLSEQSPYRALLVGISCLCALAGSLTMAHGLFIWPALALQAYVCKRSPKLWLGLLLAFFVSAGLYSINYQMPSTGMGLVGQLKRPMRALQISCMVVAGSISNRSLIGGVIAGALGLVSLGIFLVGLRRSARPAWPSVYLATGLFAACTASLTAAGRISPELLKLLIASHSELLPSRYQTFGYVFWVSIFALGLWFTQGLTGSRWRLLAIPSLLVPALVVFADAREQSVYSSAWGDAMHAVDATGTSLLLDAQDWEREQILWSNRLELSRWVQFTRIHRLATFSEERYGWLNLVLADRFHIVEPARCEGKMEVDEALPGESRRVTGWAWDRNAAAVPRDVVLVDESNRIAGLARGGLRHHEAPGHTVNVVIWRAGWLGYYHSDRAPRKAFAVLADSRSVCALH